MPLGMSFAPQSDAMRRPTTAPPSQTPVQEAIRVLSLQLPRLTGASGPTPGALMAGAGAGFGGPTSNPILEQLLRALFAGRSPQAGMPGLPTPGMPSMPSRPIFPGFTFGTAPPSPTMPMPPSAPMGAQAPPMMPEPPMMDRGNEFIG